MTASKALCLSRSQGGSRGVFFALFTGKSSSASLKAPHRLRQGPGWDPELHQGAGNVAPASGCSVSSSADFARQSLCCRMDGLPPPHPLQCLPLSPASLAGLQGNVRAACLLACLLKCLKAKERLRDLIAAFAFGVGGCTGFSEIDSLSHTRTHRESC